jgi:uncharacterized protein YbjT (DUF2867 family)
MRIAVAGATGTLGKQVVRALLDTGHEAVPISRSAGVDLLTGIGLEQALDGAAAVIDVSNKQTTRAKDAIAFFTAVTKNLMRASAAAGVGHYVAVSIVGIDRVGFGYYQGKLRQEELVLAGDVPSSVLRATQFFEFARQTLALVPGPVAIVPKMRTQPIAAREVGAALVTLASGAPVGVAPELAGPREESLPDMARRLLQAEGRHRLVVPVRMPGAAGRALAGGGSLPVGPGPRGVQTFDEWLDDVRTAPSAS